MKSARVLLVILSLISCSLLRKPKTPEEEKQLAIQQKLLTHKDPEVRAIAKEEVESRQYFSSKFINNPQTDYQKSYNATLIQKREREIADLETRANRKIAEAEYPSLSNSNQHCLTLKSNTELVTGYGYSEQDAERDLQMKLPSIGIFQKAEINQRKANYGSFYNESTLIKNSIKANFDYVMTQKCKIGHSYAISALIPKDGISYFSNEDVKASIGELASFKERNVCKEGIYTVVISGNTEIQFSGGAVIKKEPKASYDRYVVCGPFKMKADHSVYNRSAIYEVWANQNNLIYVLGSKIRDYSQELQLEMVKNGY